MNILNTFKSLFLNTFGGRRYIDVLDSENQSRSGKIRTGSGSRALEAYRGHQKYENKKEGYQII